jgi:hypothetical protein
LRLAWLLTKLFATVVVVFVSIIGLKFEFFVLEVPLGQLTLGLLFLSAVVWIFLIILWLLYAVLLIS